ncbi:hypothetical protein E3T46_07745 [Cryobacterium sp. Hh11]|uniref:hypothetical protein n=1 Tax=Cryobacterium sp. Hh11 TaxID=2555868 RepID=UPI00106A7864|nr:hypothetical protein [Cryobacterium sp. Hh11]TFD51972.1 hypothetical protein E3T46_07745 [Cryobacterium sp. Hh11]
MSMKKQHLLDVISESNLPMMERRAIAKLVMTSDQPTDESPTSVECYSVLGWAPCPIPDMCTNDLRTVSTVVHSMPSARDELSEPRIGYFNTVTGLHNQCLAHISAGDIDLDDWVYRSRDTCSDFLDEMANIGLVYRAPRQPRRGLTWLYRIATKLPRGKK